MRTQKPKEELLADEVAEYLIKANLDLVEAEDAEAYEQCALITTAINIYLTNEAMAISQFNTGYTTQQIFQILKDQNEFIYTELKK